MGDLDARPREPVVVVRQTDSAHNNRRILEKSRSTASLDDQPARSEEQASALAQRACRIGEVVDANSDLVRAPPVLRTPLGVPAPYQWWLDSYPQGPERLLLLGPPGTGKSTRAADGWIVPALADGVAPDQILACSFTNAASKTLADRILAEFEKLPKKYRRKVHAQDLERISSTIHSEAFRLLKRSRPSDPPGVLADGPRLAEDQEDVLACSDRRQAARRVWELARHRCVPVEEISTLVAPQFAVAEIKREIAAYEDEKRRAGKIDFADMLTLALDCEPEERELLLVDEAQDLTPLEWDLVSHWASASRRVVVIGDPDQAIYGWAGATPDRLLELPSHGFAVRRLEVSRRVPRLPHALARQLILQNRDRIESPYLPAGNDGRVSEFDLSEAIAAAEAGMRAGRTVFVLARTARGLGRYARALADRGVPFCHERGRSPIQDETAVNVAQVLVGLRSGGSVERLAVRALVKSLPAVGAAFGTLGSRTAAIERLDGDARPRLAASDLRTMGFSFYALTGTPTLRDSLVRANVTPGVADALALLVEKHGDGVLTATPLVTLTTIHGAKGREAALVLVDLTATKAIRRAISDREGMESERRVLYVGTTRTLDELLLVRPAGRWNYGAMLGLAIRPSG